MPVHQHGCNVNIRLKPRGEFSIGATLSPTAWCGLFSLQSISSPAKLKFSGYWTAVLRDGKKFSHKFPSRGAFRCGWTWLVLVSCGWLCFGCSRSWWLRWLWWWWWLWLKRVLTSVPVCAGCVASVQLMQKNGRQCVFSWARLIGRQPCRLVFPVKRLEKS